MEEKGKMAKGEIMYDKVLSARSYLEMMTGNYYCLRAENQLEEVEEILGEQLGKGAFWSFSLDDISYALKNGYKVVLVECVNIITNGNEVEQDSVFRWFEVPDDWTKEMFIEKLNAI